MNTSDIFLNSKESEQSLEAEKSLIGSIILDGEKILDVSQIVTSEDFYYAQLGTIYKVTVSLYMQTGKSKIDVIQLLEKVSTAFNDMPKKDVKKVLADLMNYVPTPTHAIEYANIVKKYSALRESKKLCLKLIEEISADTAIESIEKTAESLIAITQLATQKDELKSIGDVVVSVYNSFFDKKAPTYLNTGFSKLDYVLGGIEKTDLCFIAARPGTGKTAFSLNLIERLLKQDKKVVFFSLEMSEEQVIRRLFSTKSKTPMQNLKNKDCDKYAVALASAADWFVRKEKNFFVYDSPRTTVQKVKNCCMLKKDIDVIVIDYLGYLKPSKNFKNLNEAIGEITGDLKALAKDLKVPIICLAQLNRAVDTRADNRPMMSDLRDSGSIEQDANQIVFLFLEDKNDENSNVGAYVAKNRDGGRGTVLMNFDRNTQTFLEMEKECSQPSAKKRKAPEFE